MIIANKNVIGKVSDIRYAVDELLTQDLGAFFTVFSPYGLELESSEILDDVKILEDGVYVPTEYKISYRGSNEIDDPQEWQPIDFKKRFEISELQKVLEEIK